MSGRLLHEEWPLCPELRERPSLADLAPCPDPDGYCRECGEDRSSALTDGCPSCAEWARTVVKEERAADFLARERAADTLAYLVDGDFGEFGDNDIDEEW